MSRDFYSLHGRTAIVTGGASGIGLAVAERFVAADARVIILDRDADAASKAATTLGCSYETVDLSDAHAVGGLRIEADILVNNAGIQHVAPIEDFDPEMFSRIQRLMVEAPFLLARMVLPGMYDRGWGRLVHLSSVHGHRASAFKSAYVTAKHGLEGLSKVIALEAAGRGVTSNTVAPGYVRTPLVEGQIAAQAASHGIDEDAVLDTILLARTPSRQMIEPTAVAEAVAFLCGPAADAVTGTSVHMDGGWTAA